MNTYNDGSVLVALYVLKIYANQHANVMLSLIIEDAFSTSCLHRGKVSCHDCRSPCVVLFKHALLGIKCPVTDGTSVEKITIIMRTVYVMTNPAYTGVTGQEYE